jgi:hypothetical protein
MQQNTSAGLCETCAHVRRVVSDRSSMFYRCGLSDSDPRFPKYPRLPVLECSGYASNKVVMPVVNIKTRVSDELDRLLLKAINGKYLIKFNYKGQERIAEPHDYGLQKGIARLFCYQIGGKSSSPIPGWRLVDVSGMQNYELLEKHFAGNRETPTGRHHQWEEVFARVDPPPVS